MLSIDQKAHILRRAGVAIPERQMAAQDVTDGNPSENDRRWVQQVEGLHARHALERATRSLHQAEASLQLGAMRHPSNRTQTT